MFFLTGFFTQETFAIHNASHYQGNDDCHYTRGNIINNNSGTSWQVHLEYKASGQWLNPITFYADTGSRYVVNVLDYYPRFSDRVLWWTSCVDPNEQVDVASVDYLQSSGTCTTGDIYDQYHTYNLDVTCKTASSADEYRACTSAANGAGDVELLDQCPSNGPWCGRNGQIWRCDDYCGGDTPKAKCEYIRRSCYGKNSGAGNGACKVDSRLNYAAVCNDPDGGNDGGNRCAPNPPANSTRSESAFCQGPAGTDRAAGLRFNWDRIPAGLERDKNPYDIQFRKVVGNGDLHTIKGIDAATYSFPGDACTSGPGDCSLPYDVAYEWRIQAHTEDNISGPTDWSGWRPQRTNDCSGKPDLRITAFTFPNGNSAGTSDATVTVNNNGDKGTGAPFNVRVNNGNGDVVTVQTSALAEGGTREVTVPNIARPNAGSYTATAIVDPVINGVDQINEANETNNDRDDPYNTTSHIGGIIFIDDDEDGIKDPTESLFTSSATVRVDGVNYTTTNGNYQSAELSNGQYNISMPTLPTNYNITAPVTNTASFPIQRTLGPNRIVDFGLSPQTSTITVNVFKDYGNDGVWDVAEGDEGFQGVTITVTGRGSAGSPYTTDVNGRVRMANLDPGNSTITLNIPSGGYTLTTPKPPAPNNEITVDIPPGEIVNFGLWPPGPTCAGGLTATPSTVNPGSGVKSDLRCVNPTSPTGDPLTYTWFSDGTGTVDNVDLATSTWRSPTTTNQTVTNPSVTVCYQGTNRCSSSTTTINLISVSTITGNVYIDENENGIKDPGESNYTGNVTITANPVNGSSSTDTNGAYTISNLPASSYTISYTDLSATYRISYPQNGPPPNFTVTVGNQTNCNTSIAGYNSASCTNGSISNLNFGIVSNAGPWVQSDGSDMWFNSGYPYTIPAGATCQSYASLLKPAGTGTPGIIYTGVGSDSFGLGQASANPYNWKVGGISSYSESYGPASTGSPLATSYSYIRNLAVTNGTPPTNLTTTHCGAGGIASCNLSVTLASGIYEAVGDLTLANNYSFPANRDYVILVSGNLKFNGTIDVPPTSTVLFSVQGNIYVDSVVGTSTITSTTPHLEGWFSTDHSFYIEGDKTCPTRDNRLNVEGSIVVNASLQGGSFYNLRDLCSGNSSCPVFYIKERPDFSLNAPRFIKNAPRVYREVAP